MEAEKDEKVCLATCERIKTKDVCKIIEQSADGILYDLNMEEMTTIDIAMNADSNIGSRWINDLAVAFVIRKLKEELDKYKKLYGECKDTK